MECLLIVVLQLLRRLRLERRLAGETLVDDGADTPEVRLGAVLQ